MNPKDALPEWNGEDMSVFPPAFNRGESVSEIDLSEFVDKYYVMNPKTENLLPNGGCLRNGMKVLIELDDIRADVSLNMNAFIDLVGAKPPTWMDDPYFVAKARMWNRWVTVTELVNDMESIVSFVGVFDDGTKKQFRVCKPYGWYVKIDTIPLSEEEATKRFTPWAV